MNKNLIIVAIALMSGIALAEDRLNESEVIRRMHADMTSAPSSGVLRNHVMTTEDKMLCTAIGKFISQAGEQLQKASEEGDTGTVDRIVTFLGDRFTRVSAGLELLAHKEHNSKVQLAQIRAARPDLIPAIVAANPSDLI